MYLFLLGKSDINYLYFKCFFLEIQDKSCVLCECVRNERQGIKEKLHRYTVTVDNRYITSHTLHSKHKDVGCWSGHVSGWGDADGCYSSGFLVHYSRWRATVSAETQRQTWQQTLHRATHWPLNLSDGSSVTLATSSRGMAFVTLSLMRGWRIVVDGSHSAEGDCFVCSLF